MTDYALRTPTPWVNSHDGKTWTLIEIATDKIFRLGTKWKINTDVYNYFKQMEGSNRDFLISAKAIRTVKNPEQDVSVIHFKFECDAIEFILRFG